MIADALQYLYPDTIPGRQWEVTDDGTGPAITHWDLTLGEIPDAPTLAAAGLAAVKQRLSRQIDTAAEAARLRYITPGAGMAMTYQEKFAQAQGVQAMGEQAANALSEQERAAQFPTLSASVGIEAATLYDCAVLVLEKYAQFAALSMTIERTRLAAKKAIAEAETVETARAAYEAVTWTA